MSAAPQMQPSTRPRWADHMADLAEIKAAKEALPRAFQFHKTPEGPEYWWRVVDRLRAMHDELERAA